jgi:hypothetical protein
MTDFNKWYKSAIESQSEDPPAELWDAIQDDLDVEAVWTRLDGDLAPARIRPLYWRMAAAASLLMLAALGGWYFLAYQPEDMSFAISDQPSAAVGESLPGEVLPTLPLASAVIPETEVPSGLPAEPVEPGWLKPPERIAEAGFGGLPSHDMRTLKPLLARAEEIPGILPYPSDEKRYFSETVVGIGGQFANTWLLNDKTIGGLGPYDLTSTQASFGQSMGIRAGTNLGNRSWIWLDWHFVSRSRQRYNEYINGRYVSTSLDLDYHSIAAIWQYKPGQAGSPHRLAAGLYAGMLRNARQELNGSTLNVTGEYANLDHGLLAGYEYVFAVRPGITIGTGIYGKIGFSNVYAGSELVPAHLNHTRNAALMLSLSINYRLR